MHGAAITALTIYDMLKPIDKGVSISNIRLEEKRVVNQISGTSQTIIAVQLLFVQMVYRLAFGKTRVAKRLSRN